MGSRHSSLAITLAGSRHFVRRLARMHVAQSSLAFYLFSAAPHHVAPRDGELLREEGPDYATPSPLEPQVRVRNRVLLQADPTGGCLAACVPVKAHDSVVFCHCTALV